MVAVDESKVQGQISIEFEPNNTTISMSFSCFDLANFHVFQKLTFSNVGLKTNVRFQKAAKAHVGPLKTNVRF